MRSVVLLTAAALTLALQGVVGAQEADELVENEELPGPQYAVQGGFVYQGDADLDGGGDVRALRFDIGGHARTELAEGWRWANTLFFGANDYDFGGGGFAEGDPWGTVLSLRYGTRVTYDIDPRWGITGGGIFIFSPETGARWGDSFTGGGLVEAEYRHSQTFFVSFGVAVISQIEDDVAVTPSVGLLWKPEGPWTVRVGAVPATGGAAAAGEVAYRFADPVELGLGVVFQERRFRLDDSGLAPEGVGEDNSLPVRLRLGWNIIPELSLNLLGGVALAGEVELEDANGSRLRKEDYDPAAYVGVRLIGSF